MHFGMKCHLPPYAAAILCKTPRSLGNHFLPNWYARTIAILFHNIVLCCYLITFQPFSGSSTHILRASETPIKTPSRRKCRPSCRNATISRESAEVEAEGCFRTPLSRPRVRTPFLGSSVPCLKKIARETSGQG